MLEVPKGNVQKKVFNDKSGDEEDKDAFSIELNSNFENEIAEKFQMSMKDDEDQNPTKSNIMETSITLIKSQVGIGVLCMPFVFNRCGYLLTISLVLLVGLMNSWCVSLIDEIARIRGTSFIFHNTLTKNLLIFYRICLFIYQFAICIAYNLFFLQMFEDITHVHSGLYHYLFYLTMFFCFLPFALIRDFSFFSNLSILGLGFIVISFLTIILECSAFLIENEIQINAFNSKGFGHSMGIIIFSFEGVASLLICRESMAVPSKFIKTYNYVNLGVMIVKSIFEFICAGALGNLILPILLLQLDLISNRLFPFILMYGFSMVLSFPGNAFPVFFYFEKIEYIAHLVHRKNWLRSLFRIGMLLSFHLCALLVKDFHVILNLNGSIFGVIIHFIYPVIAYHLFFKKVPIWKTIANVILVILTSSMSIIGGYHGIHALINRGNEA